MALAEPIMTTTDAQLSEKLIDYPTVTMNVGALTPHPRNYNTHPQDQIEQLVESLTTFGQFKDVVIWKCEADFTYDDGAMLHEGVTYLVCGHGLWMAAVHVGFDELTAKDVTGVSPETAEAILMVDNAAPLGSAPDMEKLSFLLSRTRNLQADKPKLAAMLARLKEDAEWDSEGVDDEGYESEGEDTEPQVDKADELRQEWGVESGQLWQLGEHRIICGDCTDEATVKRLMGKDKACLYSTDPPYGVAYGVETGSDDIKYSPIANDENDGERLQAFLESAFSLHKTILIDNAAWYLWHAQMTQGFFAAAAAAAAAAVIIHRQIIWVKPSLVLGHGDYHWRHELCFYGWIKGNRPDWYGDRSQTTIWEIGRENDKIHPTQKPVEIFERPMRFNTKSNDIVFEPFSGSGSQIIAAENMSRRCRAMELDKNYVAVTLQRFYDHTGIMPELIEQ